MVFSRRPLLLAMLSVCATGVLRVSIHPILAVQQAPLILFILPVIITARLGGIKCGIYTTVLSLFVGEVCFAHYDSHWVYGLRELVRTLIFFVEGVFISLSCERMLRDASRYLKAEREAEQYASLMATAKNAAEAASKSKDKFISALSHELRTPLTPVAATITLLESDPMVSSDHREMLKIAHRNIDIEIKLIDDLLDLSRIASGKMVLCRRPTSLHEAITHAHKVLGATAKAKDIELILEFEAEKDCVDADTTRLDQVVWNLLGNAIKFTPFGGRVAVRTRMLDHSVIMEVDDNGVGIPPDLVPRLFQPFEQGEYMTRQYGGLGLGLSISNTIVAAHGGTLTAESKATGGALFRVMLPYCDKSPELHEIAVMPRLQPRGNKAKLLLVEDHDDTARLMAKILRARGYDVTIAGTVADALAVSAAEMFDLLVSDLGLPDGSGHDVMNKIKGTGIKGIALSGYGTSADKAKSADAGFIMHLTKPISVDELETSIEKVLVGDGNR